MYKIIIEKTDELKNGKTNKDISNIMGMNKCHLTSILTGKGNCTKLVAMVLINIRTKIPIGTKKMENELKNYFHEVK